MTDCATEDLTVAGEPVAVGDSVLSEGGPDFALSVSAPGGVARKAVGKVLARVRRVGDEGPGEVRPVNSTGLGAFDYVVEVLP